MDALQELAAMLRPAGGGVFVVSTGRAEQENLQRRLYDASSEAEVIARFEAALENIEHAKVVVLGVPSDVGAGYLRGANMGPQGIRQTLFEDPSYREWCVARGILDIGDVFVVPQLLHDEMLSEAQIESTRRAIYPDQRAGRLPVSPLSITERVLGRVLEINPRVKPFVLGGDHSCAWPVTEALHRHRPRFGIVQIDAHTDLLTERLGIRYCFATWSHHASVLLGGHGRLTQVGIRATRRDKMHWESTEGVRQFWAEECMVNGEAAIDAIVLHVKSTGVRGVYFSNDIDGTDEAYANATGTPEPAGLSPLFVTHLIERLGREVGLIAGDIMEVAPPIGRTPDGAKRTLAVAAQYSRATLEALLRD